MSDQSTFWWAEPPAKVSPSRDCDKDSTTQGESSCLPILRSLGVCGLDGSSGKMFTESCRAAEDGTLVPSSGRWGTWGMGGPTASWTLNGSEANGTHAPSRSDGGVCSLSHVLETSELPPRYFLSAKACNGIKVRAERRGKSLPPILKFALEHVVSQATP